MEIIKRRDFIQRLEPFYDFNQLELYINMAIEAIETQCNQGFVIKPADNRNVNIYTPTGKKIFGSL